MSQQVLYRILKAQMWAVFTKKAPTVVKKLQNSPKLVDLHPIQDDQTRFEIGNIKFFVKIFVLALAFFDKIPVHFLRLLS